ncbi:MFS transporter [Novosphingobium sp. PY1]|uniref:MFS transporter n=1 Tax=Novosphingobium sp. PY1 TaxID=1882221 RepID=UPI001A8C50D3|nr:MFS transporter [Novosphingobium sp. PY1]GFM30609.1 MFS transporter AAHS family,3-hydroxyphenylpropionic acid transporter [Novosphingobium sp. PY1]
MASGVIDPREIVDSGRMTWRQIVVVALCVLLNGLDGFDVLSISFAAPGIASDWGVDRAALGIILSMELIGMSVGSILLGMVADRVGRIPVVVVSLLVMAAGMTAAALSGGIVELAVIRLITGLGIGGMLACTNAIVAEASNARYRSAAVAIMAAGYPLGAIVGGAIASSLLVDGTWRDIFWLGAGMTVVFLPIVLLVLPESIDLSMRRFGPEGALGKVNKSLQRLGHRVVEMVPPVEVVAKADRAGLFKGDMRRVTILLTVAYFFHMTAFYFILKWIPKIVVDLGFEPSAAGGVLVWANVGGMTGSLLFSVLATRMPLRKLMIAILVLSFLMIAAFGFTSGGLDPLKRAAAIAGFFSNAAVVGLYALIAAAYPAQLRAGGTGFVIGIGRGGAAMGPVVAGFLFANGFGLALVAAAMGLGSVIAALAILGLPLERPVDRGSAGKTARRAG